LSATGTALPDWARAFGGPLCAATIRHEPSDFLVTENLAFEFTDSGDHDYLWVQKTGANTVWVARQLAAHAEARAADVGYAGLKDRHAITRQWFSVPRSAGDADWQSFSADGVEILETRRHQRKLRRGAHRGNSFRIALRSPDLVPASENVEQRLRHIETHGVPNYFGPQRFGNNASNLGLARSLFAGRRLRRDKRSIAISAARSFLFNEILSRRVNDGTWDRMLPGELANLDGSGSVFEVAQTDVEIERRCAELDIHPTATLWGLRSDISPGVIQELEFNATEAHQDLKTGLERIRAKASQRALRLRVADLTWRFDDDALWLEFTLPRGAFATSVIREIVSVNN
jgi:tRNA pseudouridine13 synthase